MEQHTLGTDNELLYLHDSEHYAEVVLSMSRQAHQHIRLFTLDLDRRLFGSPEVVEAFTQLATSSSRAYIQILLQSSADLVHHSHRLLDLARRISSYIEIRVADVMHQNILENFYLFDEEGWVKRSHREQYVGEANFHDARGVRDFEHRFKMMWDRGEPDPQLRRMTI
jgi:hypothetical protein